MSVQTEERTAHREATHDGTEKSLGNPARPKTDVIQVRERPNRHGSALRGGGTGFMEIAFNSVDRMWEVDSQGKYILYSETSANALGYTPDEMLGQSMFDFMPTDSATALRAALARMALDRTPIQEMQTWSRGKSGNEVCFLTSAVPIPGLGGIVEGHRGVDKNITEDVRSIRAADGHSGSGPNGDGRRQGSKSLVLTRLSGTDVSRERLTERTKELECIYGATKAAREHTSLPDLFRAVVDLIPPAFHDPDATSARIRFGGQNTCSGRLCEEGHRLARDIVCGSVCSGTVEVFSHGADGFLEDESLLLEAITEILAFAIERSEAEREQRRVEDELNVRNKIAEVFLTSPANELYSTVLALVLKLLESDVGTFAYIDEHGALVAPSLTRGVWSKCMVPAKTFIFPREDWGDSAWPRAIREQKTIYSNTPSTEVPDGHLPIRRHITIPIIHEGTTIGLLQVANKDSDYDVRDIHLLQRIVDHTAPILHARLERDREEEHARTSVRHFRVMLEKIQLLAIMTNCEGAVTYCNDHLLNLTGWEREDIIGRNWFDHLLPETLRSDARRAFDNAISRHRVSALYESEILSRSGDRRLVRWSNTLLYRPTGAVCGMASIGEDMTARKLTEEALKRYMTALEASNRELEQFAYVASHDLKEPLRVVSNYVQLLQSRYADKLDKDGHEFMARAVEGTARMQGLIDDILAYSKISASPDLQEPTDCEAVLADVVASLKGMIGDSCALVTHDSLPRIVACPAQMFQLFANLTSNAIKFRADRLPLIHFTAEEQGSSWLFSVADNGIGIEPEYAERIFGIFQRLHTRDDHPGNGIGLAICKKVVESHGGRIWVESVPGEGSVFYFSLPKKRISDGRD